MVVVAALVLFAFVGPLVRPVDPDQLDLANATAGPSAAHPLGTDESGRDVLARLMSGGRVSLGVGVGAMSCALIVGVLLGGIAGTWRRWGDPIVMRVTDGVLAIPALFLLLTALTFFGPTLANIVLVIGLTSWMGVARLVRGEVLVLREELYVEAARALGSTPVRAFARHILPQLAPIVAVAASVGVGTAILTESALSFLGLGVQPPAASWGNMLSGAQGLISTTPRLAIAPGIMILVTVAAFNLLGDALGERG
jgi:peptide/nickel transport system permease protein